MKKMVLGNLADRAIRAAEQRDDPGDRSGTDLGTAMGPRHRDGQEPRIREELQFLGGQDPLAVSLRGTPGKVGRNHGRDVERLGIVTDDPGGAAADGRGFESVLFVSATGQDGGHVTILWSKEREGARAQLQA